MQCTSCDNEFDTSNDNWTIKQPCMHMICKSCASQPICGSCFKAQLVLQKNKKDQLISKPKESHSEKRLDVNEKSKSQETFTSKQPDFQVYIGNLPYETTTDELRLLFSLCGNITQPSVNPFITHQKVEQSYGHITLDNFESFKKALTFHGKVYKGLVLKVFSAKKFLYSVHVQNVPDSVDAVGLAKYFQEYGRVINGTKLARGYIVNFEDDTGRQNAIKSNVTIPINSGFVSLKVTLKEPKKVFANQPPQPSENDFPLFVQKIPIRTSESDLQLMFTLFGTVLRTHISPSPAQHTYAFVHFTTPEARNLAIGFNGCRPHGWDRTLNISLGKGKKKNDVNIQPTTVTSQNSNLFTSQFNLAGQQKSQCNFTVRITGFNEQVSQQDLETYFAEAGELHNCVVKSPPGGQRYAFVNYKNEDGMNKALSWGTCLFGYPSQTLKVEKSTPRKKFTTATSANSSNLSLCSSTSNNMLSQSSSQQSLNGKYSIMVDNISNYVTVSDLQIVFENCGTILNLDLMAGSTGNVAKICFAEAAAVVKAKEITLPLGFDGTPMFIH